MNAPTRVVALCAVPVLLLATACGGHAKIKATPSPSTTVASSTPAAPSTSVASTTAAPAPAPVNPLTGLAPVPAGPVVGVKIDDTPNGRPMRNINLADVVYIEQVEGGLTRLLAVFATNKPAGRLSVRSTRASDPELVAQYGPIDYVASGGASEPVAGARRSRRSRATIGDRNGPGLDP